MTIDSTAPTAPATALSHSTDTGPPAPPRNADNITNNATPDFTGSVEPNATVTVFINGVASGTGTADATGLYTVTVTTGMKEGLNNITIVETDVAGNVSVASPVLVVRLDTTAAAGHHRRPWPRRSDTGTSAAMASPS